MSFIACKFKDFVNVIQRIFSKLRSFIFLSVICKFLCLAFFVVFIPCCDKGFSFSFRQMESEAFNFSNLLTQSRRHDDSLSIKTPFFFKFPDCCPEGFIKSSAGIKSFIGFISAPSEIMMEPRQSDHRGL